MRNHRKEKAYARSLIHPFPPLVALAGQLYGRGKVAGYVAKVHQGDVVTVRINMEAGTLAYAVNGVDKGVAFTGIAATTTLWPAVGFYGSEDEVALLRCEGNVATAAAAGAGGSGAGAAGGAGAGAGAAGGAGAGAGFLAPIVFGSGVI